MNIIETLNEAGPWLTGAGAAVLINSLITLGKSVFKKVGWSYGLLWDIWNKQVPVAFGVGLGFMGLPSPEGVHSFFYYVLIGALSKNVYELLFELFPKTKQRVKDSLTPPTEAPPK